MNLDRRRFLRHAAVAAATGGLTGAHLADASAPGALPHRELGRTRQRVSLIGIGMAPLGSSNTSAAQAATVVHAALDAGITYVDVSPDYGNTESKLAPVLKTRRDGLFLVTKVNPQRPDRAAVVAQVEESLKRMGTDRIDAVHIHNLGDWDMDHLFTPDGALAGLKEARTRGLIRFIGTSGHMRPPRFVTAIESGDIDLTMNALNFADRNHYAFEDLVLPIARKHRTAIVAMKVLGGAQGWRYDGSTPGTLAEHHEHAIRYALGLPDVACAVIGLSNVDEVRKAVEVAKNFRPLSASEQSALLQIGVELAQKRGLYYGPVTG